MGAKIFVISGHLEIIAYLNKNEKESDTEGKGTVKGPIGMGLK